MFDYLGRVSESYDASGGDNGLRYWYNGHGYLTTLSQTNAGNNC